MARAGVDRNRPSDKKNTELMGRREEREKVEGKRTRGK